MNVVANQSIPAIEASGLYKRYHKLSPAVLTDFHLTVQQGEFFGLLGPNGAGKTTLLSILSGLLKPDKGSIRFFGTVYNKQHVVKKQMGLVPQELALYERLSARENLLFFGKLYGLYGKKLHMNVDYCLETAQLTERQNELVSSFSGGMKRRLNFAIGFINQPRILFLDEPTVGIDTQSRHLIHQQLLALHRKGTTMLYTTHYMEEAEELCSRVAIFDCGKILLQGKPAELLAASGQGRLEDLFLALTGKGARDSFP